MTAPDTAPEPPARRRPSRWSALSLRARVTLVAGVLTATGLALAGALLLLSLRAGLIAGLDDAAETRAADASAALRDGDIPRAVSTAGGDSLVQVLKADGTVLAASPPLQDRPPLVALPVAPGQRRQPDVRLAGREMRVLTLVGRVDGTVVVVASPLDDVEESLTQLTRRLLIGGPVLLALICASMWVLLGYTLRTVDRMRVQVEQLSAAGLERRLEVPPARDQVRQLALTMNSLLARLQSAVQGQRRFVADAAHELRSPLAALRTRLEVNQRAGDPTQWQEAAPAMIADFDRLTRLVDDLLALARLDESPRLRRREVLDLDEIVFAEAARARRAAPDVTVDVRQVSAALVHGDPDLLTRVVANLLSNAVRHAHTRVQVTLSTSDDQVELTVADDGPGVPAAERERVFERFHRLDAARTHDSGGSGLGLAIVRDAVRAHGGSVVLADARPGALVSVWLPQQHGPSGPLSGLAP